MNNPALTQPAIPCRECSAGQMRMQKVTYYTWLMDELITVADFPAWVCDVCGRREYDQQSINQLTLILSPNAGQSTKRRRTVRKRQPMVKHKSPRAKKAE